MRDPADCDCDLCLATRKAMDDQGVTDPREREFVRDFVEAQASMIDVMIEAEEAGFDLERPQIEAVMDQIFNDDEPSQFLH